MKVRFIVSALALLSLSACAEGNLHTGASRPLEPPKGAQALDDPQAPYGSSPANWSPSVGSYDGSKVKLSDHVDQADRPDYEQAKWSVNQATDRAGTF